MLRFEDPIFLWLLWIIPVLILIRLIGWRRRKAKLKKLGDPELLKQLMPNISKYRPTVKFVLMLAALALLIVMVARPQMGSKISHDKRHGIETIICLDISNSMLCQDVVPSRLDKSKMLIENLVDNFNNDKIGLIVFAVANHHRLCFGKDVSPEHNPWSYPDTGNQYRSCHRFGFQEFHPAGECGQSHHRYYRWRKP